MNRNQIISIALFTGVALAAGYWWGHTTGTRGHESPSVTSTGGTTDAAEGSGSAVPDALLERLLDHHDGYLR